MCLVVRCVICGDVIPVVRNMRACYCSYCKRVVALMMKREWNLKKRLGVI